MSREKAEPAVREVGAGDREAVELERMLDVVIGRARVYGGACINHARGIGEDRRDQRWQEMEEAASSFRVAIRTTLRQPDDTPPTKAPSKRRPR